MKLNTTWKPLSLFHVVYLKGDHVGYFLAYMSMVPIVIVVVTTTVICLRRDLHTVCALCMYCAFIDLFFYWNNY